MNAGATLQFGLFSVFGFAKDPGFLKHRLPDRLGIVPRTIDFGRAGRFFFYTSYGETAETEVAIALKIGFVRTPDGSSLSAQQLLDRHLVTPEGIDVHALRGNALVACFSKVEAKFSVYKTLLSGLPFYYSVNDDILVCSDRLRCLIASLDRLELDEAALPQYFVFHSLIGSQTYLRNAKFLRAGERLKWEEGSAQVRLLKDLRALEDDPDFGRLDAHSPLLYQRLKDIVGVYLGDVQRSGAGFANLLSGGVDSSVTQLLINENLPGTSHRSYSFRMHAPSFEPEVEYATQAQLALNTEHVFVDIQPRDYPDLLVRSTEVVGQPIYMSQDPCKLALAEFLAKDPDSPHYFFYAQGADAFFGESAAKKIRKLELLRRIPASALVFNSLGGLLKPMAKTSQKLLKVASIIKDLDHPLAPINILVANADYDLAMRCFGEKAILRVLEIRREQEIEYKSSHNYMERAHLVVSLSSLVYLLAQDMALFMANGKEMACLFTDEGFIRTNFAVRPEKRYIKGSRTKCILKGILEQRSSSPAPRLPKLGSNFDWDLYKWMRSGPLSGMVRSIERPSFLSKPDFEELIERPNYYFLWGLLTFDIFSKRFLKG